MVLRASDMIGQLSQLVDKLGDVEVLVDTHDTLHFVKSELDYGHFNPDGPHYILIPMSTVPANVG